MVRINTKDLEQLDQPLPERTVRHHAPKSELESSVVKSAAQAAKTMGWYVERRNTGAASSGDSFVRYGTPGGADLIVVVNVCGLPVHIEAEAKRPSGGIRAFYIAPISFVLSKLRRVVRCIFLTGSVKRVSDYMVKRAAARVNDKPGTTTKAFTDVEVLLFITAAVLAAWGFVVAVFCK